MQRYLVAKTDRDALKGVSMGALLCVPVWTLFMLIGTCTWSYFKLTGEKLPAYITKADQVFPYFLSSHLPVGMAGLFMASHHRRGHVDACQRPEFHRDGVGGGSLPSDAPAGGRFEPVARRKGA